VQEFAAVILTGGAGARLGGVDKAAIEYAGRSLLARAVDAVAGATEIVVVGPPAPTPAPVRFTREDPPSGGPAAGLLAGRDALRTPVDLLVVLAVDMPLVSAGTVARLLAAAAGRDGAFLEDATGRRQLAGVLHVTRLDAVRSPAGDDHGLPLHRLLADLDLARVPAEELEARDIDTWSDLRDLTD
jgi:molybdopterin-guanine dinucleotide biosynthesis protein A